MTKLNLPQEFALLALSDQGNVSTQVAGYKEMYFLAAILMELAILNKISVRDNILYIKDQKPT